MDKFLVYLQSFFTNNTPIKNQIYSLDGHGMGIPSAIGLAAKAAVGQLFTNVGFTVTINVNS